MARVGLQCADFRTLMRIVRPRTGSAKSEAVGAADALRYGEAAAQAMARVGEPCRSSWPRAAP